MAVGPAIGFAGAHGMYLIPEMSAVVAPESASHVALLANGIAQAAMMLTLIVGDMAVKSQDFVGIIRTCNWVAAAALLAMMGLVKLLDTNTLTIPTSVDTSPGAFTVSYHSVAFATDLLKLVLFYVLVFVQSFERIFYSEKQLVALSFFHRFLLPTDR